MATQKWDFQRHDGEPYPIRVSPEQVATLLGRGPPRSEYPSRDYTTTVPYLLECGSMSVYLNYERCGVLFPRGYGWLIIEDPLTYYPLVDLGSEAEILADPRLAPRTPPE